MSTVLSGLVLGACSEGARVVLAVMGWRPVGALGRPCSLAKFRAVAHGAVFFKQHT